MISREAKKCPLHIVFGQVVYPPQPRSNPSKLPRHEELTKSNDHNIYMLHSQDLKKITHLVDISYFVSLFNVGGTIEEDAC